MQGLLIYGAEEYKRNQDFSAFLIREGKKLGINLKLAFPEEINRDMTGEKYSFGLVRVIRPKINQRLEEQGIRSMNSYEVSSIANDKYKTYECFHDKVPCIPSQRIENVTEESIPHSPGFVIKSLDGHGGKEVFLSDTMREQAIQHLSGRPAILQPYEKGYSYDIRVYVLGGRIVAAVKRKGNGDFRSNFSVGGSVEPFPVSELPTDLLQEVTSRLWLDYAGVDLLYNGKDFLLNEIEDVVGARMLYKVAPDCNIGIEYLKYVAEIVAG